MTPNYEHEKIAGFTFLHKFKFGNYASQTVANIKNGVSSQQSVYDMTVRHKFQKFRSRNSKLEVQKVWKIHPQLTYNIRKFLKKIQVKMPDKCLMESISVFQQYQIISRK